MFQQAQTTSVHEKDIVYEAALSSSFNQRLSSCTNFDQVSDRFAHVCNDRIIVSVDPLRGFWYELRYITVERNTTFSPELILQSNSVQFLHVETPSDFDRETCLYYQPALHTSKPDLSSPLQIILHLSSLDHPVVSKTIPWTALINSIYTWIADELEQLPDVCDQLHFSDGYALYDYTEFGQCPFDKPIHIVSRRSLRHLTSDGCSRIYFGYYYITESNESSFLSSQQLICERHPTYAGETMTRIWREPFTSSANDLSSSSVDIVDISRTMMLLHPMAKSVQHDPNLILAMADSGCELSIF